MRRTRTTRTQTPGPDDVERAGVDEGYRFDDPYWDDVFGTLYDPAMGVCSVYGC